jgi:ribosomal protein S18 acetylase RimI-like enzyme
MHVLDNARWQALTTRQAHFAESFDQARRFVPEVSVIGAFLEPTARGYSSLAELLGDGKRVNLALEEPYRPQPGFDLILTSPILQMVYQDRSRLAAPASCHEQIVELGSDDVPEMLQFTALTKPGPFIKRTHELGTYLGVRLKGKLVAMAGERLKVPGYTEVSAVCTHPDHRGKGYARIVMGEVIRRICDRGETPFLHVLEDNVRAVELYQKLGFATRVSLHLAVLRKTASARRHDQLVKS